MHNSTKTLVGYYNNNDITQVIIRKLDTNSNVIKRIIKLIYLFIYIT